MYSYFAAAGLDDENQQEEEWCVMLDGVIMCSPFL
jgi:hypothetical protein